MNQERVYTWTMAERDDMLLFLSLSSHISCDNCRSSQLNTNHNIYPCWPRAYYLMAWCHYPRSHMASVSVGAPLLLWSSCDHSPRLTRSRLTPCPEETGDCAVSDIFSILRHILSLSAPPRTPLGCLMLNSNKSQSVEILNHHLRVLDTWPSLSPDTPGFVFAACWYSE